MMPIQLLMDAGLDVGHDLDPSILSGARVETLLNGEANALGDGIRVWEEHLRN